MADRVVRYVFQGQITDLQTKLAAAGASVGKLSDDLTKADKKSAQYRQGLTAVGDTAGKVGLVAAAGLGAVVAVTANFDQAMSNVQAATHETAENMDALREAAIKAGADTAFSASEAAAGIENLAKAGVSTGDVLGGGLAGALDLAAAGEMEVADAAETAATAMTQFNLEGSKVPHIADLLAAGAGKAQGDVSDLAMALKQSGLVASQMGLSIEETTGTLAAFASAGLLGSDAGTSFRTMLLRLANPSGEAADLMDQLGISAYDAQGQFVGMEALAGQLSVAFEGQSQATRDAAMATIFGSDAIRAASVLYSQGAEGVAEWTEKVDDAGYAAETAATRLDNLKGDLEALGGSLETALIGTGEGSQGAIRSLVQGLTDAVNAYNDLPPAAQNATAGILGVTAAAGGGLWAFSKIVQGISDTRVALDNLGVSAGKAAGALKVVGAGVALGAIVYAADRLDEKLKEIANISLVEGGLAEDLEYLAATGKATGTVFDTWGAGMKGFGEDLLATQGRLGSFVDSVTGWTPIFDTVTEKLEDNAAKIDGVLAMMVKAGDEAGAERIFDMLQKSAEGAGADVEELADLFPEYGKALEIGADSTDDFSGSVASGSSKIEAYTDALEANIDAMRDQRSEAIRGANAAINYQASLDDARASLKENGRTLDITTEKGRANKTALLGVASAWNDQSAAAKNAPGAHKAAIESFVNLATQMGMGEEKARALARRILELPDKKVKVEADTSQADYALSLIKRDLSDLDGRTARTYVTTVYSQAGFQTRGIQERATGGYVAGPGTATSDSIPAYLSNGEYVVRAAAVDKYGTHMFDRLNAMAFADGGYVARGYAAGGSVAGTANLRVTGDSAAVAELAAATRELAAAQQALAAAEQRSERFESAREQVEAAQATAKSLKSQVASRGDLLRQEQRLRDIRRELNAEERDKEGNLTGRKAVRGLDRRVAQAELAEAQREMARMKRSDDRFEAAAKRRDRLTKDLRRNYQGTAAEARRLERAEERLAAARDAAAEAEAQRQAREEHVASRSQAIQATAGVFGDGFLDLGSVSARMQRAIDNASEFTTLMGQLSAKGTSPFILAQLDQEGPTEGALVFARQLLKDEAGRRALNAQSARLVQVGTSYGRTSLGFSTGWSEQQIAHIARDAAVYAPVTVNAPQNMSPQQVGDATAQRIVSKLAGRV
jgi:TP901 family phage tail tape measure protein